ncbi:hypothetical protein SNE40_018682 [Patella caerulea]|uniref:Uncharacterized protein n=1 Tax=Patella caerulea TaxID=87958 RepID=A0AAN8J757_PATCE
MGGCYSTASNEAVQSPKHKLPRDRPVDRTNGKLEKEVQAYGGNFTPEEEEILLQTKSVGTNCEEDDNVEKRVVPSDSGIESLAPNSIKDENESPSRTESYLNDVNEEESWYNQTTDCNICKDTTKTDHTDCAKESTGDVQIQTYCSCGPRHAGKSTWQSNSTSICKTHMNSPKSKRNSDIAGLKSSFRDFMRKTDKKVRLSWKSSDSLDINKQMTTHLDRTKSEASEIFKDDISFCAPLAKFDSVDYSLDRQNSKNRISTLSTTSEIEALARDICNCEFYANNLTSELDSLVPEKRHESFPTEAKNILDKENSSEIPINDSVLPNSSNDIIPDQNNTRLKSKPNGHSIDFSEVNVKPKLMEKRVVKQVSLASLSSSVRPSLSSLADVTMTTHEGRDMVMIDVDTYTQILEELSLLKSKLSQLTTVIQEDPQLDQAFQLMETLNFEDSLTLQQDTVGSETDLSC